MLKILHFFLKNPILTKNENEKVPFLFYSIIDYTFLNNQKKFQEGWPSSFYLIKKNLKNLIHFIVKYQFFKLLHFDKNLERKDANFFISNWYVEYLWHNIKFLEGLTAWFFFNTQNKILSIHFIVKLLNFQSRFLKK